MRHMKYDISKNYFKFIIYELIYLKEKCSLCSYVDHNTTLLVENLIDMLKYYMQFSD